MSEPVIIGNATLYLGRCEDILPLLCPVDVVLTDPPYGLGTWSSTGGNSLSEAEAAAANEWDVAPSREVFDSLRACSMAQIIWGGNYFIEHLGSCRAPLVWDKRNRGMHLADGEFAWTSFKHGTLRIFERPIQATEVRQDGREHPTQKPIDLMKWCIAQFKSAPQTILDPFLGSGTTGIAAVQMHRSFIGIEKEQSYFDIACKRIEDAQRQGSLFGAAA